MTVGTTNGRCGYSQRLPMVVISPYTRENYVSSNLTDTASVVKFIEDNWLHGESIPGSFDKSSGSLVRQGRAARLQRRPAPHAAHPQPDDRRRGQRRRLGRAIRQGREATS